MWFNRDAYWSWRLFPVLLSWYVSNEYLLVLEVGIMGCVRGKKVRREGFFSSLLWMRSERNGDHSRFPATELEMRQGAGLLDLWSSRRVVVLPSAYLLPWEKLSLG